MNPDTKLNVQGTVTGRMSSTKPFVDHCGDLEPGAPNLDAMDRADLHKFIAATRGRNAHRAARRLFPSMPGGVLEAVRNLNEFAFKKVIAIACRERGYIPTAVMYELLCDQIYHQQLPGYARW